MGLLSQLRAEELQIIGILQEIDRLVSDIPAGTQKLRQEHVFKVRELVRTALRVLYKQDITEKDERQVLQRVAKDARELIKNLELAET